MSQSLSYRKTFHRRTHRRIMTPLSIVTSSIDITIIRSSDAHSAMSQFSYSDDAAVILILTPQPEQPQRRQPSNSSCDMLAVLLSTISYRHQLNTSCDTLVMSPPRLPTLTTSSDFDNLMRHSLSLSAAPSTVLQLVRHPQTPAALQLSSDTSTPLHPATFPPHLKGLEPC